MKTITINLNVTSIPVNTQPAGVRPCPRVNVFQHPIDPPTDITAAGTYTYTFNLDDNDYCGVDVFAWKNNSISLTSDVKAISSLAGEARDQIRKTIIITNAGTYDIAVAIQLVTT